MKWITIIATAFVLVLAFAGCAAQSATSSSSAAAEASASSSTVASSSVSSSVESQGEQGKATSASQDDNDGDESDEAPENTMAESEAISIAESTGGGEFTGVSNMVETDEHGWCWYIETEDDNGNSMNYYIDASGAAYNVEFE